MVWRVLDKRKIVQLGSVQYLIKKNSSVQFILTTFQFKETTFYCSLFSLVRLIFSHSNLETKFHAKKQILFNKTTNSLVVCMNYVLVWFSSDELFFSFIISFNSLVQLSEFCPPLLVIFFIILVLVILVEIRHRYIKPNSLQLILHTCPIRFIRQLTS